MTTYYGEKITCGACGEAFEHQACGSTNTMGYPDLDCRPALMQRYTMGTWVQRCPGCGYCAVNAGVFEESMRPVLAGEPYATQLRDPRLPKLAASFICSGFLREAVGDRKAAGLAYLHAAWCLDDANATELARTWRATAATHFLALLADNRQFDGEAGAAEAIAIDCLRRAGRAADALELLGRAKGRKGEPIFDQIFAFQKKLIERGDVAGHTVGEAVKSAEA